MDRFIEWLINRQVSISMYGNTVKLDLKGMVYGAAMHGNVLQIDLFDWCSDTLELKLNYLSLEYDEEDECYTIKYENGDEFQFYAG